MVIPVQQQRRNAQPRCSTDVFSAMGPPRLMSFDDKMTCKEVHTILWEWAKVGLGDAVDPEVLVFPHHTDGLFDPVAVPPTITAAYIVCLSDEANVIRCGSYWDVKLPFRTLPYSDQTIGELSATHKNKLGLMLTFEESRDVADLMETAKAPMVGDGGEAGDGVLNLDKCLDAFSAGEQLSKMDTWYCPKCKDHVQAFKKMDLWSVPPVLALHLKRFQYDAGYFRDKIDAAVQFNEFLDMSPHVMGPQKGEPLKYELFGVSNHIGFGIGGGHYTAYAKVADKWALYNDSSVSECTIDSVCTDEAYVLFYRLMSDEPEEEGGGGGGGGGGGDASDSGADEGDAETAARVTSHGSSAAPESLSQDRDADLDDVSVGVQDLSITSDAVEQDPSTISS
jgi:hypothetical protein